MLSIHPLSRASAETPNKIDQEASNIHHRITDVLRTFLKLMAELSKQNSERSKTLKETLKTETDEIASFMKNKKIPAIAFIAIASAVSAFVFASAACPGFSNILGNAALKFPRGPLHLLFSATSRSLQLCGENASGFASAGLTFGQTVGSILPDAHLRPKETKSSITMNDLQSHTSNQETSIKDAALALLRASEELRTAASRS